jgi:hypothetical protein
MEVYKEYFLCDDKMPNQLGMMPTIKVMLADQ